MSTLIFEHTHLGNGMTTTTGRRDRSTQAKRERIFAAASTLFAELGFQGTTTQAVSDRADIAAGTLFRYAATKAELLLMVYNTELRQAITAGRLAAESVADPAAAVFAAVRPVLVGSHRNPDNAIHYQRELLFGVEANPHRAEGLALVVELERVVSAILLRDIAEPAREQVELAARCSRIVFSALHLALAQPSTHTFPDKSPEAELRAQIAIIVAGFASTTGGMK